jgi:hypothetical protein
MGDTGAAVRTACVTAALLLSTSRGHANGPVGGYLTQDRLPRQVAMELIFGSEDMVSPVATVAHLDAPGDPLVAGSSMLIVDEVLYVETSVGFLWHGDTGATAFDIDDETYWSGVKHFNTDIADTGSEVVRTARP